MPKHKKQPKPRKLKALKRSSPRWQMAATEAAAEPEAGQEEAGQMRDTNEGRQQRQHDINHQATRYCQERNKRNGEVKRPKSKIKRTRGERG